MINGKRIKTIDVHSHCHFHEAVDLMGEEAKAVLPPTKGAQEHFIIVEGRLKGMDAQAIDMEVLSINPFWYRKDRDTAAAIVKVQNEKLAELCASRPDRFAAFASLALQFPDLAVQQLDHAVRQQGLRGAAVGASVLGEDFSEPTFHPVWAKAEELGAVIFIHPQSTPDLAKRFKGNGLLSNTIGNPLDTTIALQHLIFEGTLDRFPGLKSSPRMAAGISPFLRGALRSCLLRVAEELQPRYQAEEEADRISEPALLRRAGVHPRGAPPPGGAGGREPDHARQRPPDSLGGASGRSRLRHRRPSPMKRRSRSSAAMPGADCLDGPHPEERPGADKFTQSRSLTATQRLEGCGPRWRGPPLSSRQANTTIL